MINSMEEFVSEINAISNMGYVMSHRKGNTGIGKTLEDLLGITENNINGPDFDKVELKSARKDSLTLLTLTTKSPDFKGANNLFVETYGYYADEYQSINPNLKVLHTTIHGKGYNNLNGERAFKLVRKDDGLYIQHFEDGILDYMFWSKEALYDMFANKYPDGKLYYVKANSKIENDNEYFNYNEAYYLEDLSVDKILDNIDKGIIVVDIRIGMYTSGSNKGRRHDHGTRIQN